MSDALEAQGCFSPYRSTPRYLMATARGRPRRRRVRRARRRRGSRILRTLTEDLSARERLILYLRFVENRTQAEIGEEIGVTQMQVSRLLNDVLRKMRDRGGDADHRVA